MSEIAINLEMYSLIDVYGVNDKNLNQIRSFFPKLKLIARGDDLRVVGEESEVETFKKKFSLLLLSYDTFGRITENDIVQLMGGEESVVAVPANIDRDILVHGRNGMIIKARTANQHRMVDAMDTNDLLVAIGPAGTGKTYTAVALAVRALKNKEIKRIILTRPAVEAGENLGFLPGDLKDKLDPYLQPLYDALRDMLPAQKLLSYIEDGTIEIAPLAFMRGRTLDNVFAILDEAQNATQGQLKMFLTRMGRSAKFIVTGDITQIDLPKSQSSGLVHASRILHNIPGLAFVFLDETDVIRHKLVTRIIKAYASEEDRKQTL
ncbi:MAG: PhoH family protein [Bacteroidales bacterium]|nr:PhoH family protein [Bacteroidales bacterium]MDZ4204820.1 PhoH family protein [Bacteroidales bacterium]